MTPKQVERLFEQHVESLKGLPIRLQDTKDAKGSLLKANPSDYVCVYNTGIVFSEVKSFRDPKRFPFKNIEGSQLTYSALITRLTQPYLFYIFHVLTNTWYKVPAEIILSKFKLGVKSLTLEELKAYFYYTEDTKNVSSF